jgi:hypothetical protein
MKFSNYLRNAGYDLIEGPVRNHKLLQLYLKQGFNEVELYYDHITHAFKSQIQLREIENTALDIKSTEKDSYGFNIGITLLSGILKSLGLGVFDLSSKIKSGKTVTISYDNSITKEIAIGEIGEYLSDMDFNHENESLLKNANHENILIITGVLSAKNLVVEIETDYNLDANLIASLNNAADGKLDFTKSNQTKLKMVSTGSNYFPVAVKASRLHFDGGVYKKMVQITDNRNFF